MHHGWHPSVLIAPFLYFSRQYVNCRIVVFLYLHFKAFFDHFEIQRSLFKMKKKDSKWHFLKTLYGSGQYSTSVFSPFYQCGNRMKQAFSR